MKLVGRESGKITKQKGGEWLERLVEIAAQATDARDAQLPPGLLLPLLLLLPFLILVLPIFLILRATAPWGCQEISPGREAAKQTKQTGAAEGG